ncbi:MAG: hypothetical protein CL824_05110 [Crocinitomicaceae bacterium]|nr:hypothetical protein [Crocinitomicaceae bacterium]
MEKINWLEHFNKHTYNDWESKALKETKGDQSKLLKSNLIEEIDFPVFLNKNNKKSHVKNRFFSDPKWKNGAIIEVESEHDANKKCLDLLMNGVDFIYIDSKKTVDWKNVFNDIQLEYINTQINSKSFDDSLLLIHSLKDRIYKEQISFNHDICDIKYIPDNILKVLKVKQLKMFYANGYGIQSCGANTWEEIAYSLSCAHEILLKLLNTGFTIDEAAACIHFSTGMGSNYYFEISKIRSLKILWSRIINAYNPEHACSSNCFITAHIGLSNKSLDDPYTNVLRQTTESMSAIIGGVDQLIVHPYDETSIEGKSNFSEQLGINISLILKEESHFGNVSDPLNGSYLIDYLTNEISEKAWLLFNELEDFECTMSEDKKSFISNKILKRAEQRIKQIKENEALLIGINAFKEDNVEQKEHIKPHQYLGMNYLNFENSLRP